VPELPRIELGNREKPAAVRAIAAEQHGVVSRAQPLARGLSNAASAAPSAPAA